MKKNLFFLMIFLSGLSVTAQEKLNIEKIFEKYGMHEGAVLVELYTDVLAGNTKITIYKSMVLAENDEVGKAVSEAVAKDMDGGSKIMESVKNGKVETGYYHLPKDKSVKTNEYILYKNRSKKITLIYLKGNFPPQKLEDELDKLKDVFIYVNKKRIKLQ